MSYATKKFASLAGPGVTFHDIWRNKSRTVVGSEFPDGI